MTHDDIYRLAIQAYLIDKVDCSDTVFVKGDVEEVYLFAELVEQEGCNRGFKQGIQNAISNLLILNEAADGRHNYYKHAALYLEEFLK